MNDYAILAFVVTPAFVVLLGYVAMRLHEQDYRRARARTPAE